ncbi:uncharacterized protein LOC108223397 isoform X2 [Daucus carota subsp. sativus]|uniref:uncharacterized protein LOC108223397 isoform X2 n=1 Tax=Daucus carota subsp. sativus TaxID=79200 RepID=UPI0007EFCD1F|nr:PREDICTED: uncharacterized protein LOC108223397 isoform X2 [Daucus carota subsp. sativus]
MDDKLKLKLVENRRRVQEQYLKNRVPRRPDILRQKAGPDGDKFTSKPGGNKRKAHAAPDSAPRKKVNVDDAGTTFCNRDLELKLKLMENRRRVEEEYSKNRFYSRLDILRQKSGRAAVEDKFTSKPGSKSKAPAPAPAPAGLRVDGDAPEPSMCNMEEFQHYVFLFELALGYALFDARGMNKYPGALTNFKIAEKYLNNNPFTLRAFYRFPSPSDALVQMKAICNSTVTKELKRFVADNIPEPRSGYVLAVSNPTLVQTISFATRKNVIAGQIIDHVMRGLRVKIDKLIVGLEIGDLKMAQFNLARSFRRHSFACKGSSKVQRSFHNVVADKVVVEPHKIEGLFITKGLGKKNFICTKNLVPGKLLYDDQLISIQNEDDRTEVEYRVWNPHVSKLAAAVLGGLSNIWVKPGSHVLYLGDVCGITVLQLSDLVGLDGLVYVIGLSDAVANTVEERSNVVTLPGNYFFRKDYSVINDRDYRMDVGMDYRMVVGMVDVILGDIVYPDPSWQVNYIARYALLHLKTGGHYLISTRARNINLTSQVKDPFADHEKLPNFMRMEFETYEHVMLEPIGKGHAMVVGGYRRVKY